MMLKNKKLAIRGRNAGYPKHPRTVPDLCEVHYYGELDIPNPFAGELKL